MNHRAFFGFLLLGSALLSASAADYRTIKVGQRPESVTRGFDGKYFVTVMNDAKTPGDGVVKVIEGDTVKDFATGFNEPKGIAFTGQFLVASDVKKVWKIDAEGKTSVLADEAAFPNPVSYLNDVAVSANGKVVYVTDMGANTNMMGPKGLWPLDSHAAKTLQAIGRVYEITLDGKVSAAVDTSELMPCPNGVTTSGSRLLVGDFFTGNILEAYKGKLKVITTGYRGADAIERDGANIYVSSWTDGKVWKMDAKGQKVEVMIEGLQSAADFYLDRKTRQIVLPDMKAGVVMFIPLK
ncbi:MAG: gluconolaconase [Verrucomicrobiota bacterium]